MKQLFTLALVILSLALFSQQPDTVSFTSADNEVSLKLTRVPNAVEVNVGISNAVQYEYVMVEKSAEPYSGFKQCRYIEWTSINKDGSLQLTRHDVYPISSRQNAWYRVKTIGKDGSMRIYPALCLPGFLEKTSALGF